MKTDSLALEFGSREGGRGSLSPGCLTYYKILDKSLHVRVPKMSKIIMFTAKSHQHFMWQKIYTSLLFSLLFY